jgi:peptidoglycan/xylan/chitin deacetylase (PgdA/CDA1 family)
MGKSNKLSEKQLTGMMQWRKDIVIFAAEHPGEVFINGFTREKEVALTFDDGPDGHITSRILDVLKENQVKASFFFMGKTLDEHPEVVKRADEEGHLVLSHTWSHQELTRKSSAEIEDEIQSTENKIDEIIGKKPALIRPPFGDVDQATAGVIKENGCRIVLWSIDTLDWSQMEKANIIKNVADNVRPGEIILMHSNEDKIATLQALPGMIAELREMGYRFVDLGEMLQVDPYK